VHVVPTTNSPKPKKPVNVLEALACESGMDIFKHVTRTTNTGHTHVACNYCNKHVAYQLGNTSTGNIWKHPCLSTFQDKKQTKLPFGKKEQPKELLPKEENDYITRLIIKVICEDTRPFDLFYSEAFRNLLDALNPKYALPCEETLKNLMTSYLTETVSSVKKLVKSLDWYSLTMDLWSSRSKHHYMVYTLHYLDRTNYTVMKRVIWCDEITDIHCDHEVIEKLLQILWAKFALLKSQVVTAVTDAGANIKLAVTNFGLPLMHCNCHNINLVCQDALEIIGEIRAKARAIATYFSQSSVATQTLRQIQKVDNDQNGFSHVCYLLVQEIITRWSATYSMLKRILVLWDNINSAILELKDYPELVLRSVEIDIIDVVVKLLEPMNDVTNILQGDSYITSAKILPSILSANSSVKKVVIPDVGARNDQIPTETKQMLHTFKAKLLSSLEIRFAELLQNKTLWIATFLDPQYKGTLNKMLSPEDMKLFDVEIKNQMKIFLPKVIQKGKESVNARKRKKIEKECTSYKDEFAEEIIDISDEEFQLTRQADEELLEYTTYIRKKGDEGTANFWLLHQRDWPILFEMTFKYLCFPASSSSSERAFSVMGRIISKERNRLAPETATTLLVLGDNSDMW
jgi:hypothetical protein